MSTTPTPITRISPLSLGDFAPKPADKKNPVDAAVIDAIAETHGFPSRQASKPASTPAAPRKKGRRFTTGRNVQVGIKATADTLARLEKVSMQLQQPYGEVLRLALEALERERR